MGEEAAGSARIGFVVIGRNEGERLVTALKSLQAYAAPVVYVDSGSTDGSVARARGMGVAVAELDMSQPFSAGRARNCGFAALMEKARAIRYVQFMDGDCELDPGWIETSLAFLESHPKAAIACGRRRERFPERSIYNRLCDMEWDTPVGRASECGGDFLVRVSAFRQVSGFRDHMIAGEEPELCVRLLAAGWEIWRLDAEMTRHDANILQFRQWWRRAVRCGHAYAAIAYLHGTGPDRSKMRELRSAIVWGGVVPLCILGATLIYPPMIAVSAVYVLQAVRIAMRSGRPWRDGILYGVSVMLGKFAELTGIAKFWANRLRDRADTLIEYK